MKSFDNISAVLKDDLMVEIKKDARISIASACFSIYAFEALKKQLENIAELRFVFSSPTFTTAKPPKEKREFYIPRLNREKNLYGTEFEIKLRNQLTQKAIAKECAEWIKQKAHFKSNQTDKTIPHFMTIENKKSGLVRGETLSAYSPINGLTTEELGCERGNNYFTIINKLQGESEAKIYLDRFNEIYNDKALLQDVTDEVIENITTVYNENAPEFIYFFALYNIFYRFLQDNDEDLQANERTGFKESVVWKKLYTFQQDACRDIIHKLEKYNGCILADSVGLGKTFTALAVIKYYESRNKSVLVLCPKKLADNWITYKANYLNNPLVADKLRYDVLYHTDLSRSKGKTNDLDLAKLNWGNYDLVVIDESHNFRTGGREYTNAEQQVKDNRYNFLLKKIIQTGVQTKVLMLSATPVNNRFNDLKHQLALAYDGNKVEFNQKLGATKDIDAIFREAQRTFNDWDKLPARDRTAQKLLNMLDFDFINLLDNVTIARSRKHIEEYYNMTEIGQFPTRLPPKNLQPALSQCTDTLAYKQIYADLLKLNLSIYVPSAYITKSKQAAYEQKYGSANKTGFLRQGDREKGTRKLVSIGLMKRLESSIYSFNQSLMSLIDNIKDTLNRINDFEQKSGHSEIDIQVKDMDMWDPDALDDFNISENAFIGKKVPIQLKDMDWLSWRHDLQSDLVILENLYAHTGKIGPAEDNKLQTLLAQLRDKFEHPINENNQKVLIFTAFADTAGYLYEHVSRYVRQNFGLDTALITGSIDGKTTDKDLQNDMNTILTCFSPLSKDKHLLCPDSPSKIDVLIATDCISEGQNLQDCDYLVNYDIHWNPVRIIQRFGRIDRIGSHNKVIQLVNFWAPIELDEYIKLKVRVEERMAMVDITSGGNNNVIKPEDKADLEYRKIQLEKLQKNVVDIEEMGTGVSIMDLGLNEFKLDLLDYIKDHPHIDKTPLGMNAVVPATKTMPAGVIFVLKNINADTTVDHSNRLHPFYTLYIQNDGTIVVDHLHPKELLDKFKHACKGKNVPDKKLCAQFNAHTEDGKNMQHYSRLLGQAIDSMISVKAESDVDSLFHTGGTSALIHDIKGLNDFELICFLIVEGAC